jgi:glucose-1-phosphate thymidylyltransferase
MKVIIPIAGEGRRLRPHTYTKPKPLLPVAGKPIIEHVMDKILPLNPTQVIFIIGHLGHRLEKHLRQTYPDTNLKFIEQKELNGTAGAVWLAKEAFDEDVLIDFGDTIFDADLSIIKESTDDAIIWAKQVEDYQRFGVIVTDEHGYMTKIVEKPQTPISKLANIGLYYIKNTRLMEEGIIHIFSKRQEGKEVFLTDAFAYMIQAGAKIKIVDCDGWYDCGTAATLLETNRALLDAYATREHPGVILIPPVFVHPSAKIESSTIGPYVSIAANVVIRNSKIADSIIDEGAEVYDAQLTESIIGVEALVKGNATKVILSDHSRVECPPAPNNPPMTFGNVTMLAR